MKLARLLSIALLAVAAFADAAEDRAPDVPDGVVLAPASAEARAKARGVLETFLAARSPEALAALFADVPPPDGVAFLLGTSASRDVIDVPGFEPDRAARGEGQVVVEPPIPPVHYSLVGARTEEHRQYLATRVLPLLPAGTPSAIRPPSFDELAYIWFFIGWDLDEPLLVADWDGKTWLFDFDAAGERITWIERVSEPCFKFGQGDRALTDCQCIVVAREQQRWEATFQPRRNCPK